MKGSKLKLTKRLRVPKTNHEEFLSSQGFEIICGVDEVGRGAWAGPLVAGAVILNRRLYGLRDSKLLSAPEREKLSKKIKRTCVWGIGEVSVEELNELKLTKSTQLAFKRAVKALKTKIDFILLDGISPLNPPLYPERNRLQARRAIPCRALKKGDLNCASIAAASIIAKVHRDKIMRKLDQEIKGYYFAKHKGYGTKLHQRRLKKLGPSFHHRKFYKSIK